MIGIDTRGLEEWEAGQDTVRAGDICQRLPGTISPESSIQDAARQMRALRVGTLLVSDDSGHPRGILTSRDIVRRCVAAGRPARGTRVGDVMSRPALTIDEHASVEDALHTMGEAMVRRLIVVESEGRLTGLLTLDDIVDGVVGALLSTNGGPVSLRRHGHRPA